MLAGKGSSGSDRLNVLSDQAFHLHCGNSVMDPEEIPAYFERFRKVWLVLIFGVAMFHFDAEYDLDTLSLAQCAENICYVLFQLTIRNFSSELWRKYNMVLTFLSGM